MPTATDTPLPAEVTPLAAMSLLADGRFPSGGHAHSNGFEAASQTFGLDDAASVERFISGRLRTTGRTEAALVAATINHITAATTSDPHNAVDWLLLDCEVNARILSPRLREVSRSLGRQWLRAGKRIWNTSTLRSLEAASPSDGPHQVVAYAAVCAAAGMPPIAAVTVHLHHLVSGIGTAAVRLHGLDPFKMQRTQWELLPAVTEHAEQAVIDGAGPLAELPASTGPVVELLAQEHSRWETRLFQS
ncbi:MAG: urease accessory protein UreF [Acidimicrobiales bacterium]